MSKLLRDDIEYAVHCDDEGKIIWPISKIHAHIKWVRETLCHYSTWSMVFNPVLWKYWIQLKNPKKQDSSTWGKWDMWVAWHNCYVENNDWCRYLDFEENLEKEAEEEIWIQLKMYKNLDDFLKAYKQLKHGSIWYIFDRFLYSTEVNKEFVWLGFIVTCETELKFTDNEVVDFKWLYPDELLEFIHTEKNICEPLKLVYEKAEIFRKEILK
ncbi:MAG: hypothetical protein ACD_80C00084G0018 [uncultured bacterium (gcode 4)]|uniref:Nudix hydrolase domain-containing protein n=1 Tax=uncultured bacterium (gcode 4) TaxID=1234023 RepID=K1XJF5_9BACT|nr:MAG: hypothetical protein ACD_80C00084G0018 [uncultured bacterium (gcode 4)]